MIAVSDPERAAALARFPLSRVSEAFHDEMLGVLPPVHMRGAAGFFVSEAVTNDVHAQFVEHRSRFYGAYVLCAIPRPGSPNPRLPCSTRPIPIPPVLDWYPAEAADR